MSDINAFRKQPDAQIPDILMLNNDLSLAAVGLYVKIHYLLTRTDIALEKSTVREYCNEGERAFTRIWKELKDKGYLKVYRIRRSDRKGFCYEYELLSEPDTDKKSLITIGIDGAEINKPDTIYDDNTNDNENSMIDKKESSSKNDTDNYSSYTDTINLEKSNNMVSEDYDIYFKNNIPYDFEKKSLETNQNSITETKEESESILKKNMSMLEDMEAYRGVIEFNIEYNAILYDKNLGISQKLLDEWITMIIETILSKQNNFIIDEKKISKIRVSNMFQRASKQDIITAIKKLDDKEQVVKCDKNVMRECLWKVLKKV